MGFVYKKFSRFARIFLNGGGIYRSGVCEFKPPYGLPSNLSDKIGFFYCGLSKKITGYNQPSEKITYFKGAVEREIFLKNVIFMKKRENSFFKSFLFFY